jgi:hypothetical protein
MAGRTRPKRVVVVDAENPLREIHGEFFWREDHARIVAEQREDAFRRGYADGYAAARSEQVPQLVIRRRRRHGIGRLLLFVLVLLIVVSYAVTLVESFGHT